MKWLLAVDYATDPDLVQWLFDEEPQTLEHCLPVVSYHGMVDGIYTRVSIPVNNVLGWTLEEVEDSEAEEE